MIILQLKGKFEFLFRRPVTERNFSKKRLIQSLLKTWHHQSISPKFKYYARYWNRTSPYSFYRKFIIYRKFIPLRSLHFAFCAFLPSVHNQKYFHQLRSCYNKSLLIRLNSIRNFTNTRWSLIVTILVNLIIMAQEKPERTPEEEESIKKKFEMFLTEEIDPEKLRVL